MERHSVECHFAQRCSALCSSTDCRRALNLSALLLSLNMQNYRSFYFLLIAVAFMAIF
jgi:hypothetical protein